MDAGRVLRRPVQPQLRGAKERLNAELSLHFVNARKPIIIVGGGLAGLALGIGLRRREVPVLIYEAGKYPRHRVCGEFISGHGLEVLGRLGLRECLDAAGTSTARTSKFFAGERPLPVHELPTPALCVSRFVLDAVLADEFTKLGGELRTETRWTDPAFGEGIVRATGRRAQGEQAGARWFGLKAHVRNVTMQADLEMYLGANSYVGLCRLPNGESTRTFMREVSNLSNIISPEII